MENFPIAKGQTDDAPQVGQLTTKGKCLYRRLFCRKRYYLEFRLFLGPGIGTNDPRRRHSMRIWHDPLVQGRWKLANAWEDDRQKDILYLARGHCTFNAITRLFQSPCAGRTFRGLPDTQIVGKYEFCLYESLDDGCLCLGEKLRNLNKFSGFEDGEPAQGLMIVFFEDFGG